MKRRLEIVVLLAILSSGCADRAAPRAVVGSSKIVELRAAVPLALTVGDAADLRLTAVIADGFHIQANPAAQPYLIPTVVEIAAGNGVEAGTPAYPRGEAYRLQGADEDLSVYDGSIEVVVPLRVSPTAAPGDYTLEGSFRYQACDDKLCLAPVTLPLEIAVTLQAVS